MAKFDLENSFSFFKTDSDWIKKLLIGSGISILAVILILAPLIFLFALKISKLIAISIILMCWIISFILFCAVNGFCIEAAHERIYDRSAKLPEWNEFWTFVFLGFKSTLGSILFYCPLIAIASVVFVFEIVSKHNGSSSMDDMTTFVNCIYNILYFVFLFFYFVFSANFLKDYNVFSYINVVSAYKRLKGNWVNYFILVALILAFGFMFNLLSFVLFLTVIGILLIPFVFVFLNLLTLDLTAQFLSITEENNKENL